FIDFVRFTAKGGDGGDGCVSFHREKYLPKGPPNGGNGGRGGDVILRSSVDASTLKYLGTTCNGKRGQNGLGGGRHGMTGDHCVIEVPVGTVLRQVDFSAPDQEVVLCRGGTGGYGNPYFLTNDNRSPKFATRGRKGEVRAFEMELKTIADVGLVGLPNAGKSTLLGAISNAHPKQASYAFTTLHPYVGTVDYADSYQLTVADIPGLIQGAHKNIGLGHAFLRHVERAKMLVYVIDLGGVAPWEDLRVLQYELEAYHTGLTQRPSLIIANKADKVALAKENLVRLQREAPSMPVVPVSALYEKNILKLTSVLRTKVEELRRKETQTLQRIDSDV
ncbi:P-loop containing nucleoside triphosphate hydrolase protein, partial [Spinellus fusiger]